MSGKQMEGDSEKRRARARRAREEGGAPSAEGTTLGASKQREHEIQARRAGPPAAGTHKRLTHDRVEGGPPEPPPQWPRRAPVEPPDTPAGARYQALIEKASSRTNIPFDQGRLAAEATVTVLARALAPADRERLLARIPAELRDDYATSIPPPVDLVDFLGQVATITHRTPEQARHQAQAVLSTLYEQDPALLDSLALPWYLPDLLSPPPVGGGVVAATTSTPPLSDGEVRQALARLPRWSGDRRALRRSVALPPDNLERVLRRLADLKRELGRGPRISRDSDASATLTVRTARVGAVTAPDVDLAERIDAVVEEAGAGMAAG